jgi:hypothetical protein
MADPQPTERKTRTNPPPRAEPPAQQPGNDSAVQPNDGPRVTHPPAGKAIKRDPDGSGRAVYPSDRPDLYGPMPTDADGRRDRDAARDASPKEE